MPERPTNPRNYPAARLLRQSELYQSQGNRQRLDAYPRPAQPNMSQPNQKTLQGWGMTTTEYWENVFKNYLRRRG